MRNLICAYNDFSLWEIKEKNELHQLDQFVLKVYYYHHLKQNFYPKNELSVMIQEDIDSLTNSSFFVAFDNNMQIIGTIKLQKWDGENELSIEKDFKVDLKEILRSLPSKPKQIYHIGRFAIDQNLIRRDPGLTQNRLKILKLLMYYALFPVFEKKSNIFLCECDDKLLTKLKLLGIYPQVIGPPKVHLGSKTLPIYCNHDGIKEFIKQNDCLSYV